MGRKRKLTKLRHSVQNKREELVIGELRKLKAPLWRRVLGLFNVEILRSWYKDQESRIDAGLFKAARYTYRRMKR